MSLYGLDDSVRQLLQLDSFASADFSTKNFIEELSQSQRHASGADVLDPKPYIRTFEAVASELQRMHDVAQHQEETAGAAADELRESHNLSVIDMAENVDQCVADVKSLDEQVSEITRNTSFLGDRLERISRMHEQVVLSRQLVEYYLSFLEKGSSPELERLFTSQSAADRRRCAHAVGQLQLLARKIGSVPGNDHIEEDVDKLAERLETHFINAFQECYSCFDLTGMKEIAQILHDFNGGASVVQAFVNQHDLFMQVDKVDDDSALQDEQLWAHLSDLNSGYPEFERVMQTLVDEISDTVGKETKIVRSVFPRPVQVLTVFMQRMFAQRMQGQIMLYIEEAEARSPLAQVRVLYVCYHRVLLMVKVLKDEWNRQGIDPDGELSLMLDTNVNDIFVMFLDKYFAAEKRNLETIMQASFSSFADNHPSSAGTDEVSNRGSDTLLNRITGRDSASYDHDSEADPEEAGDNSRMDRFMRAVRLERTGTVSGASRRRAGPSDDSLLDLSAVERVLAAFAESVGREQVLSPPLRVPHDAVELFNLMMVEVGGNYINVALHDAISRGGAQDAKADINWAFLDTVRRSANCVQLMSLFVRTVLFAMVRTADSVQSRMANNINEYVATTQERCGAILESAADLAHTRTQYLLGRQKRRDFVPKEDVDIAESASCVEIVKMLRELGEQAQRSLANDNLRTFLVSVAGGLYNDLLTHLKKFTINPLGGQILGMDLAAYEKLVVSEWNIGEVADSFATLRAIAKLFYAEIKLLPSLLRDSHFARLKPNALHDFVAQRSDFNSHNLQMLFLQKVGYRFSAY